MFDVNVVSAEHVRRYSIVLAESSGWEASLEEDRSLCWRETQADWHRMERTLARFRREVSELLDRGWRIEQRD
jgi:hypothetical protein